MKLVVLTLFIAVLVNAKERSSRGPAIDPDYPVFTEARIPGVTPAAKQKAKGDDPLANELAKALAKSESIGKISGKKSPLENPDIANSTGGRATLKKGSLEDVVNENKKAKPKMVRAASK